MSALFRTLHFLNSCPIRLGFISALLLFQVSSLLSQTAICPAVPAQTATPAVIAYSEGRYAEAEQEYAESLVQQPHDALINAALVAHAAA